MKMDLFCVVEVQGCKRSQNGVPPLPAPMCFSCLFHPYLTGPDIQPDGRGFRGHTVWCASYFSRSPVLTGICLHLPTATLHCLTCLGEEELKLREEK